jgi:uncharacterized protein YndB with AHSA1/START domain
VTEDRTLHIERTYEAPVEAVFEAWTSEEVLRRWWELERGWGTTTAELDVRVGGTVRVVMRDPATDEEYAGTGTYTELDPPHRLAFTWIWDVDTIRTLIEVDFEERDGATVVRFTQRHLWSEEAVRGHEDGWIKLFNNLALTLTMPPR